MFNLSRSPIRKGLSGLADGEMSIFEDDNLLELESKKENVGKYRIKTILNDIENMLAISEEAKEDRVKIAVMGELKAGKSTLVNVCARKEVAYMDICEATAIVTEITYSEDEFVHVLGINGDIQLDLSFDELLDWSECQQERQFDTEDDVYKQYDKIIIGVNADFFKNVTFVDTPGLLSIKEKNHDITNRYVAETDYILWVLDSEDLGSKAVNDELLKVRQSGKPIIGIVNKVDTPEIESEIRDYIVREYSHIFEEVFYISALNEWENIQIDDSYNSEAFAGLLDCIEDLKYDKEHSLNKTEYYQLSKDLELHQHIKATITSRKEYYDGELAAFSHVNAEIKKSVKEEFGHWVRDELFVREKNHLLELIGEDLKNYYEKYKSSEYLIEVIDGKYNEMLAFVRSKWEMLERNLSVKSSQVLIDFCYDKEMDYNSAAEFNEKATKQMIGTVGNGLKAGAGIGVALAGYAAWLGPAAQVITFTGAVVLYTIPLAIIGVGIGAYIGSKNVNFADVEKDAKIKQEIIEDLYKSVQGYVWNKEKNNICGSVVALSEHYYAERCRLYREKADEMNFDYEEPKYSMFMNGLQEYIEGIEGYISQINDDLPEPPETLE